MTKVRVLKKSEKEKRMESIYKLIMLFVLVFGLAWLFLLGTNYHSQMSKKNKIITALSLILCLIGTVFSAIETFGGGYNTLYCVFSFLLIFMSWITAQFLDEWGWDN